MDLCVSTNKIKICDKWNNIFVRHASSPFREGVVCIPCPVPVLAPILCSNDLLFTTLLRVLFVLISSGSGKCRLTMYRKFGNGKHEMKTFTLNWLFEHALFSSLLCTVTRVVFSFYHWVFLSYCGTYFMNVVFLHSKHRHYFFSCSAIGCYLFYVMKEESRTGSVQKWFRAFFFCFRLPSQQQFVSMMCACKVLVCVGI